MTLEQQAERYGTVEHDGATLVLTQDAYADGTYDDPYYSAHAVDADGNMYKVRWETTLEWDAQQEAFREGHLDDDAGFIEEEDACDWTVYAVERR